MIKGIDRVLERDFSKNGEEFIKIYLNMLNFLFDVKYTHEPNHFEDSLILVSRYYLHYIPSLKSSKLLPFDDHIVQTDITNKIIEILERSVQR